MLMTREYQPFIIRVGEQREKGFSVRAEFQGSSWSATIPASLPLLTEQEVQQALQWLERGFIDRDYARDFGSRLFQTLFQDAIQEGFRIAFERVATEKDGLRIVLTLPKALIDLPWELMYDKEGRHGFLARSATAPLVRHFEVETLPHKPPKKGPLRILIVTASPSGYPPVSSEDEAKKIGKSLAKRGIGVLETLRLLGQHLRHTRSLSDFFQRIRHKNLFEIEILSHATRSSLQEQIIDAHRKGQGYHVVHFVGHGHADESGGYLVFESKDGEADSVPADEFAEMLAEPTVNLAVLNACQTASAASLFRGVAQATLQRGVPATIGMQVPILDRAAVEFAQEFYGAWAAGQPIEGALAYARRLIKEETPGAAADWGIPVLFMGPVEGLTLDLATSAPRRPPVMRFLRWAIALFLSLLGTVGLLLTIPDVNKQLRTEVPIIRCAFPYPMESGLRFNVVVTEFTVVDENGSAIRSKDGLALPNYLFQQLEFNFDELDLGIPYNIRPPAHTCRIKGRTREEREMKAAELAERINADVIVYGVIIDTGKQSQFSPEFYVNYRGFEEAGEVTGQYGLGKALAVDLPFDDAQFSPADNPALSARTNALSLMTIGLAYYSIDDFEEASDYFLQAEATKGWLENAGKEVIYLLLGNANNRRASQENSIEYLEPALAYFDEALSINSTYARAEVGKAGVLYLMAIGDPADGRLDTIDLDKLDEATVHYEAALGLGNPPASANIDTKVHFGLGRVYVGRFLHALTTEGDWETPLAEAKAEFEAVVQEYESGNARIANLAGHAYARLGLLARMLHETDEAVELYTHAIELVTPHHQSYYHTRLGEVHVDACQMEHATESYEEAIRIAEFYGNEEQVTTYTTRLNELRESSPQCADDQ
jgi:tetratricopeptide (TPR) repeat protein/ribosomal protein L34